MDSHTLTALLKIIEISNDKRVFFLEKLNLILDQVLRTMNTQKGSIMLVRRDRTLEVAVSSNPELLGVRQSIDENSPASWVVRNRRILYVGPGARVIPFVKRYNHYKSEAYLLAPIISHDRVIGVLSITEKKGRDSFDADEQELLLTIAGHVISAIENKRLAESLKKSRDEARLKNVELKNLERIRTELFNMLIHDLKGPISEIVANLDILSYTTTDDNLECVVSAQSGCDTLLRMISDLLDITRIEQGCLNLVFQEIDAQDLIHESMIRLAGMAKARGIQLLESVPEGSPALSFTGDRGILLRVLQNLIINAVQHSPSGEAVDAGFAVEDGMAIFHVQDHGPGIPAEYHEAVFDKFFQIKKKSDGRRYSTGLGLTYCRMAVEAHQGSIRVESDGACGSLFIFTVPLSPSRTAGKGKRPRAGKRS